MKSVASSESTGGAGTIYEYRVAAVVLARLLAGSHSHGIPRTITAVRLQQRGTGALLDDITVSTERDADPLRTQYQVKKQVSAVPSDKAFMEVVTASLHVLDDAAEQTVLGHLGLGLIAEGDEKHLNQLRMLTRAAQANRDSLAGFKARLAQIEHRVRARHGQVKKAVIAAIRAGAPDLGGPEATTHAFLAELDVWRLDPWPGGTDYLAALDGLKAVADEYEVSAATLFETLVVLAQRIGVQAGGLTEQHLRHHLRREGLRSSLLGDTDPLVERHHAVDAEATLLGPFNALALESDLAHAEGVDRAGEDAASLFAALANRLAAAGFEPHAVLMRRRETRQYLKHQRVELGVRRSCEMAWDYLDGGRPWEAGFVTGELRSALQLDELAIPTRRSFEAVDEAVAVMKFNRDASSLVAAIDDLQDGSPSAERVAAFACEKAITDGLSQLILDRESSLRRIATQAASAGRAPRRSAARILMCLADATGEWEETFRGFNRAGGQTSQVIAWGAARYGRHLALAGDTERALDYYSQAIERACLNQMYADASTWLHSRRKARWLGDSDLSDGDDQMVAQALDAYGGRSTLPGSFFAAEEALRSFQSQEKLANALEQCELWHWQSVTRADLMGEFQSLKAIAAVHKQAGEVDAAIEYGVRAGAYEEAATAAKSLKAAPARLVPESLPLFVQGQRAGYAAVAEAADVLTDDQARDWIDAIVPYARSVNIALDSRRPASFDEALNALAELRTLLTEENAQTILTAVAPIAPGPDRHLGPTDNAAVAISAELTKLCPQAWEMLENAAKTNEQVLRMVWHALPLGVPWSQRFVDALTEAAVGGSDTASLMLIHKGLAGPEIVTHATRSVEQALEPLAEGKRVTFHIGGTSLALMASILDIPARARFASAMLGYALDPSQTRPLRRAALQALDAIGSDLDDPASLLPDLMDLARGLHDDAEDPFTETDAHPLSRFQFNSGPHTLQDLALQCAAKFATQANEFAEIEEIGIALLKADTLQWNVARALFHVPVAHTKLNASHSAVHPSPALRSIAAWRWAQDPTTLTDVRALALATDNEATVRKNLANAIREHRTTARTAAVHSRIENALRVDPSRSIRTALDV